ncbi:hypothetical protein [Acinetobacter chinensis]|uniref:hypothetical protein n=1 Tax=Acinetobacter chinensis TaxID=2004650 RepID=UPI002934254B|nr:hypothetical protein [Acinetobacter chinensis]WOE40658.1 hypothetical protein QSG87_12280 [Acinetobacter chinensis]
MDNLITLHNGVDEGVSVIQSTDISHHSFAFDQNMNPCIVYNKAGTTYCYWYDPVKGEQTTMEFDVYMESPQVSLDDHRHQLGSSDIILSYTREDKLCYRQQRDRYQIEYILGDARNQKLTQIGMSKNNRFQFRLVFDWRNE